MAKIRFHYEVSENSHSETIDLTDYGYSKNQKWENLTPEEQNSLMHECAAECTHQPYWHPTEAEPLTD